ncbi:MAG: hypothetical protein ABEJ55_00355 [Halanaeroarchaeum sp.]
MDGSHALSRRHLLKASVAGLASLSGCSANALPFGLAPCRKHADHEFELVQSWRWGELIEHPDPSYEPPRVVLENSGPTRTYTVIARRRNPTDPTLSKQVTLEGGEYVEFSLQEPDYWVLEFVTDGGLHIKHEVTYFDCNRQAHTIHVRCDNSVHKIQMSELLGCPAHPIDESE